MDQQHGGLRAARRTSEAMGWDAPAGATRRAARASTDRAIVVLAATAVGPSPPYSSPDLASQFLFGLRVAWFHCAGLRWPSPTPAASRPPLPEPVRRWTAGRPVRPRLMREFAPLVCAIVISGVVGRRSPLTRRAAHPRGARRADVLGNDPIKAWSFPASWRDGLTGFWTFRADLGTAGGLLHDHHALRWPVLLDLLENATTRSSPPRCSRPRLRAIVVMSLLQGSPPGRRRRGPRGEPGGRHLVLHSA